MNLKQMILRQQELLDTAKAEKRELTAEEQAEFDGLTKSIQAAQAAPTTPTPESNSDEGERAAVEAERARCESINALCRDFEVSENERKAFIDGGKTLDEVRAAIIEKLQRDNAPVATGGTADASVVSDAQDKFRSAAVDALIMRSGMTLEKPAEGAKELMGMSLRDLAIESLAAEGGLSGLNRRSTDEIFTMLQERQYFNPTAAFPAILDNAINKAYVEGHKTVAVTFDQFTKKGSLKDFKTADNNYLAGPAPEFLEVPEGGELKHSTMSDEKRPTRKLKTYGRQFTLTRQAFINDDIDLVTRIPAKYAASARKTINKQVYEILVNNPAVYDGVNLFHSNHKNVLASGTGITQAALQKMILALQNQKDEFGAL